MARIAPVTEQLSSRSTRWDSRSRTQVAACSGLAFIVAMNQTYLVALMPPAALTSCSHHRMVASSRLPTVAAGLVVGAMTPIFRSSAAALPLAAARHALNTKRERLASSVHPVCLCPGVIEGPPEM